MKGFFAVVLCVGALAAAIAHDAGDRGRDNAQENAENGDDHQQLDNGKALFHHFTFCVWPGVQL